VGLCRTKKFLSFLQGNDSKFLFQQIHKEFDFISVKDFSWVRDPGKIDGFQKLIYFTK